MKSSKFQFLNPYVKDIEFKLNFDFSLNEDKTELEMKNEFNTQIKKSAIENKALVELTLKITAEKEAPFELQMTMASEFVWDDMTEMEIDTMLNLNAPALLLGYMRPIVANLTTSANLPAYNLPFINFKE